MGGRVSCKLTGAIYHLCLVARALTFEKVVGFGTHQWCGGLADAGLILLEPHCAAQWLSSAASTHCLRPEARAQEVNTHVCFGPV
jgi:hypothetical protein